MAMLRHKRIGRGGSRANENAAACLGNPSNDISRRTRSYGTNSTGPLTQGSNVSPPRPHARQRGRKRRATTELKLPPRGRRVVLEPEGERQFKYVDPHSKHYKYTMQLGIILKREHPGVIEEKEGDVVIRTRPALEWSDYYDDDTLNDMGQTAADRVKQEFWNLFEIHVKDDEENPEDVEEEADRVLDNYASKKVRDMMYQLRVDAVKFYYEKQGEHLDDTLACSKELEYNQYMEARIPWFKEHAWPTLCTYWCSKGFLTKRRRGQDCRLKSQDVAQNRGGSRPFVETRQYLAEKYGTDKATILNTYAAMKSGLKNWDGSGSICSTMPRKAKKRLDDYSALARAAHPDDWEQQELDGRILYESSGGIPHGRVAIADGAIRKVDIISVARERKLKPATSVAHRQTVRENEELKRQNANLQQTVGMHQQLILTLYKELGKELPSDVLRQLTSSQPYGTTNSSQAGDDNTRNGGSGVNNGSDDSGGNIGASNPGTN